MKDGNYYTVYGWMIKETLIKSSHYAANMV